jgi:hypothetical protein
LRPASFSASCLSTLAALRSAISRARGGHSFCCSSGQPALSARVLQVRARLPPSRPDKLRNTPCCSSVWSSHSQPPCCRLPVSSPPIDTLRGPSRPRSRRRTAADGAGGSGVELRAAAVAAAVRSSSSAAIRASASRSACVLQALQMKPEPSFRSRPSSNSLRTAAAAVSSRLARALSCTASRTLTGLNAR